MTSPSITSFMPVFDNEMNVKKRNGELKTVSFDKILRRIKLVGAEADIKVNYTALTMKVIDQLYDGISTTQIDELSADQCASMGSIHPDYNTLAGRIIISNQQKNTSGSFINIMTQLYEYKDKHGKNSPLVSDSLIDIVRKHGETLETIIDYKRDYLIDYFGFKTLDRAYLMKINKKTVERPQDMWLRVSIGIHGDNIARIQETYEYMSQKYFTHATPTLFNAGTPKPQLSSCYLIAMESDSIDGIYNTLKDCALISKMAGGIGLHIHNVRATGSHIRGTNGTSNGIVPMLRVFNNTAKYVDQCIKPDTIIYTNQGPKQIQHCCLEETEIFNVNGETEIIQNVLEHVYDGEILEIENTHSITPICITPEHPIYVLKNKDNEWNPLCLKNKNIYLEWIEAGKLDENDMIAYSIPKLVKDIKHIYQDDCYMYGVLLRNEIYPINNLHSGTFTIEVDKNKLQVKNSIIRYLKKKEMSYTVSDADNLSVIVWNKMVHVIFRLNDFFNEWRETRIHHKWLNLPIEKSKYILKGLLDISINFNEELILEDISRSLIESVKFLCLKMGILPNVYQRNSPREKVDNVETIYCISIPKTKEICELMNISYDASEKLNFFKCDDLLLSRVRSIKKTNYTGLLYDLQMEKEHNYLLEFGLVHNGGGKRNGSFAIYLEPWHADIEMFLQMRKNHGDEELKARDLFYALWIPDLFMERIKVDGSWTLMCPDECPGLSDVYGQEFVDLYEKYEESGKGRVTIKARELWFKMLDAQMETGTPYILFKDAVNNKTNQKNVGIIKSSNLCCEITEYSDENETAVCNLASIALPLYVDMTQTPPVFNYKKLHEVTKIVTYNLNQIIDVNYYPTEKTKRSNMRHRPIGIGIQGLADIFMMMNLPFLSDAAKQINKDIFETIYHAALESSCEIAQKDGFYETFPGSPASEGKLQFDLWGVDPTENRYEWSLLKDNIMKHGLRNSLLVAPMPTASTSQILGFNECIEPITSNIYSRRTLAGEFILTNKYLMMDLIKLDLWNEKIKNNIISNHGSIQQIEVIPKEIKDKYLTVWEMPMRNLIDMAADRGAFICQSQSLNLWLEDPNYSTLTSMHFYSWSKGLKTGIYYLRRRGRHQAQQFTIEPEKNTSNYEEEDDICEMCSA